MNTKETENYRYIKILSRVMDPDLSYEYYRKVKWTKFSKIRRVQSMKSSCSGNSSL